MTPMLDFQIKNEKVGEITVADAVANEEMVRAINYLVDEGFIELEEDEYGEIRAYPIS